MKNFKIRIYNLKINQIIDQKFIEDSFKDFLNSKELKYYADDQMLIVFVRLRGKEGGYRTLGPFQRIEKKNLSNLIDLYVALWSLRDELYVEFSPKNLSINFKVFNTKCESKVTDIDTVISDKLKVKSVTSIFSKIPANTNYSNWNKFNLRSYSTRANNEKYKPDMFIKQIDDKTTEIVIKTKNGVKLYDIQDIKINEKRIKRVEKITGSIQLIEDGKEIVSLENVKTQFIEKIKPAKRIKDNFITMDFESRLENRGKATIHEVIAICIYDGKKVTKLYLADYKDSSTMIVEALKSILIRKYNGYKVYFHNFTRYDGVFLFKRIASLLSDDIKISGLDKDGTVSELKIFYNLNGNRPYSITFKDSLLVLPVSLERLCKYFDVENKKSIFPYKFVTNKLPLDYKGEVPAFKYFENISKEEYNKYISIKDKKWDLRKEVLEYCENDVIGLWQVLKKFQTFMFREFNVDSSQYYSLSALSFAIYRCKFMVEKQIPIIKGEAYNCIKQSYTGGSVDVYKPIAKNVKRFDVNSLFPAMMANHFMPVGQVKKFRGNIYELIEKPFGFFKVKIKTTKDIKIPVLQRRVLTPQGTRTLSHLGEWEGWYFSEEIEFAKEHGYEIIVEEGFLFEKGEVFKEYVEKLYSYKEKSEKDSPMYLISKLLLNSLYGKFGMDPIKPRYEICNKERMDEIIASDYEIINYEEFGEDSILIKYIDPNSLEDAKNISVSISSAITGYSRIFMNKIKIKYSDWLTYSDTDCVDLEGKELDKEEVGKGLGLFKFEEEFEEIIYPATKMYAGRTTSGKEIIKAKGLSDTSSLSVKLFKKLMKKRESYVTSNERWFRKIIEGNVEQRNVKYTININENKRLFVYNTKGDIIGTKPYKFYYNEIIEY